MSYRYSRDRIHEIVSAPKCVANGAAIVPDALASTAFVIRRILTWWMARS